MLSGREHHRVHLREQLNKLNTMTLSGNTTL